MASLVFTAPDITLVIPRSNIHYEVPTHTTANVCCSRTSMTNSKVFKRRRLVVGSLAYDAQVLGDGKKHKIAKYT